MKMTNSSTAYYPTVLLISKRDKEKIEEKLSDAVSSIVFDDGPDEKATIYQQAQIIGGYVAAGYLSKKTALSELTEAAIKGKTGDKANVIKEKIKEIFYDMEEDPNFLPSVSIRTSAYRLDERIPEIEIECLVSLAELEERALNPESDDVALFMSLFDSIYFSEAKTFLTYVPSWGWTPTLKNYQIYVTDILSQLYQEFHKKINQNPQSFDTALRKGVAKKIKNLKTAAYGGNIMHLLKKQCETPIKDFDNMPYLFPMANGVWDLSKNKIFKGCPEHRVTVRSKYSYDPKAQCPHFLGFVKTIFQDDPELILFIQTYMGLCLSGETHPSFLFFHGEGHNGKSLFLEVISDILGDFSFHMGEELMGSKGEFYRSALHGKRMILISEIPSHKKLTADIKKLTGNERISARFPGGRPIEIEPQFKLILASNHLLEVEDPSHGFWRRILIVPFKHTFPHENAQASHQYKALYLSEASGIINWLIKGYNLYKSVGLKIPECVQRAVKDHQETCLLCQDSLAEYMKDSEQENMVYNRDDLSISIRVSEFNHLYSSWCNENGLKAETTISVSKKLKRLGYQIIRRTEFGKQQRYYSGIAYDELEFYRENILPPGITNHEPHELDLM